METSPVQGLPARLAAARLLEGALSRRAGMDEAAGPALKDLEGRDRAFARTLALTTLRRLGQIDRALGPRLQREPPERIRSLLRLGLAQALYMGTPAFAAVDSSVALADSAKATRPFKGLVNAVLRGVLREPPADDPAVLAPDWLLARWKSAYGETEALAIAAQIALEPATDLSLRDPGETEALATVLEAQPIPGGGLRVGLKGDPAAWPGFAEGQWWVQDAAAAIPARLLTVRPGDTALDLCAAPGGKTLQLAAAGGRVTAVDRSRERLGRLSENLARTSLEAEIVCADAAAWSDGRQFDAVLLDAPCSATGTFRRHPEVLWVATPGDIAALTRAQSKLLDSAAGRVRPGGRLAYCVCSLEREEGEDQIRAFLARHADFRLDPLTEGEGGAPGASLASPGWLRLLPHHLEGSQDGFFAARLIRAV
ncbi:MAG: rRNA methyltransferase [Caulobacteraceae bacterium]|nr:rRNA methyltransferase [Caulobacteraceae bacterium]